MKTDTFTWMPTKPALDGRKYLLLFLLWPFLAFITSIINYKNKESKKVVYAFLIYYGLSFYLGDNFMDSDRYALSFVQTARLPFSDFFKIIGGLNTESTLDIAEPFVRFVVSRVTRFPGIFFATWVAIMGYFYLKSIRLLHYSYSENPGWNALIIMAFFIMILPITMVSGIRMPTATWIFFLGAYHVVLRRDPKYLLLALSSSLVHWSFISANVILIIYYLAGNRNIIYIPLVILSFVLPQLLSSYFQSIALSIGGSIQNRYEGYSSEGYILGIQESQESASWFIVLSDNLVFYFLLFAIIIIQVTSKSLMKGGKESNLFSFTLLFLAFVNFGKVIPTFGGRFQLVFYLFATLYVFMYFLNKNKDNRKISLLTIFGIFPMIIYSAVNFRVGSETINAWIFAPGLGLPLLVPGMSIAELLFH